MINREHSETILIICQSSVSYARDTNTVNNDVIIKDRTNNPNIQNTTAIHVLHKTIDKIYTVKVVIYAGD